MGLYYYKFFFLFLHRRYYGMDVLLFVQSSIVQVSVTIRRSFTFLLFLDLSDCSGVLRQW